VLQDDSATNVKQIKMPSSTVPAPATSAGWIVLVFKTGKQL